MSKLRNAFRGMMGKSALEQEAFSALSQLENFETSLRASKERLKRDVNFCRVATQLGLFQASWQKGERKFNVVEIDQACLLIALTMAKLESGAPLESVKAEREDIATRSMDISARMRETEKAFSTMTKTLESETQAAFEKAMMKPAATPQKREHDDFPAHEEAPQPSLEQRVAVAVPAALPAPVPKKQPQ